MDFPAYSFSDASPLACCLGLVFRAYALQPLPSDNLLSILHGSKATEAVLCHIIYRARAIQPSLGNLSIHILQ
ncbi:hypothetical protein L228DRAFT_246435 [Xylona heveae TC161]|uniref:Uncharacterized protein n=1 Tax=Xylona heveae (strain CBS 132557 / TC161) TaxID=1328760 RepID=A0A165HJV4_XYLHT|nr:hypothetical protein L228DRAFT_246435 [Xylona heveae TC161]KZF23623.1 hypothetical protein L228DRAFT_246435 [Xylona heveae TC161]